jgi:hypothetical protein
MIAGLDSSYDAPTLAQAQAAYAAGVRVWGGYIGSRDGLGLAVRWPRMAFWNLQQAGITAIGFCSGWDDPDWIRTTAAEWGILACVDVERGIRDEFDGGTWLPDWLQRAQCGLYGPMSVHYATGEPPGRGANFNVLAWYPGFDPRATWFDAIEARPPGPCGWQWQGTHDEVYTGRRLSVDSMWLDDLLIPSGPGRGGDTPAQAAGGGSSSMVTLTGADGRIHRVLVAESTWTDDHGNRGGPVHWIAVTGGTGGLDAWGGGDGQLPGEQGGGWIVAGTLAASLWTWPEKGRELLIVQGRGGDRRLYRKACFTDDYTMQAEWTAVNGPAIAVPGAAVVPGPAGPPGPAGASIDVEGLKQEVRQDIARRIGG